MLFRAHWWLPLLAAAAVGAAACGGGTSGSSPATAVTPATTALEPATTTAPATTTTTDAAAIDVTVVPDVIDEAYVQAVIDTLAHLDGDAFRLVAAAGAITPEAIAVIDSIYTPDGMTARVQILAATIAQDGLPVSAPGDARFTVSSVPSVSALCIAVETVDDFSQVVPGGLSGGVTVFELRADGRARTPNPTPWRINQALADSNQGVVLCG